jgi:DNA/RNA endonuclease YhcR with UshA esterase domain
MRKHLFGALVLLVGTLLAGSAWAQCGTIDEIQQYDPVTGAPASPCTGQVVTVTGDIYVVKGTYNTGTHYILGATGGIQFFAAAAPPLTYGDKVEVTGTVSAFQGEIQLGSPTITILPGGTVPVPTDTPIADLVNPFDYEQVGNFASVPGFVDGAGSNPFNLHNGAGDTIIVYVDSDTGIDLSGLANGDEIRVVSPVTVFNGLIELKPRKQSDLITNYPVIEGIDCDNWAPLAGEPVTVSASIFDPVGSMTIASATLYYRNSDGSGTGTWSSVPMVNTSGDNYEGVIPAPHTNSQVDFYLQTLDGDGLTTKNPGAAPGVFRFFAIGTQSIYAVQWAHPDSVYQGSAYRDKPVNVEAVVTAGTGQVQADSKFILQEPLPYDPAIHGAGVGDPGTYKWGGVLVYEGTAANFVLRGDRVRVGGIVDEYYGLTEVNPHTPTAVYLISYGNELPPPSRAHTRVLSDNSLDDGNGNLGEAYESVWIKTYYSQVIERIMDSGGTTLLAWLISDTGARADSCHVDPYVTLSYDPTIGDVVLVEGFMDFYYSRNIIPLADEYITLTDLTGVGDQLPVEAAGGGLRVYPNPFNPKTEIRFRVNRNELTQLNIYDIRGQLVSKLVDERLTPQEYRITWDGSDLNGQRVSSGTYFARLRIGTEVMQVQKVTILK